LGINPKAFEKALETFEKVNNSTLACSGISRRLQKFGVRGIREKEEQTTDSE
jgi:hypothetical protein